MFTKLTRTLLFLSLLICVATGAAQAETPVQAPSETCPELSAAELQRSVGSAARAVGAEAQKLNPPDLSGIQPGEAMRSLGEQANRVRRLEWREGAKALASGASSGAAQSWETVKERVAPASVRCVQQWAGQAYEVVRGAPEPNLTEQVPEDSGAPERQGPVPLPDVEVTTNILDSVRRALMNRVLPQTDMREVGSGAVDTLANTFPTAFRIVKYFIIWVVSTSILVTILLIVILARLGYILLFSSGRSGEVK